MDENHLQEMFDMFTDAGTLYGTHKTINHLVRNNVTVYQYILSHKGKYSFSQLWGGVDPIGNFSEINLVFLCRKLMEVKHVNLLIYNVYILNILH